MPTIIRLGATYSVDKKLLLHAEVEKDFDFPFMFKTGIEWELAHAFWLRMGLQINPITFNMGIGYQFKNGLRIDLASFYQKGLNLKSSGVLGASGFVPSIGLGFDFNKK